VEGRRGMEIKRGWGGLGVRFGKVGEIELAELKCMKAMDHRYIEKSAEFLLHLGQLCGCDHHRMVRRALRCIFL
jgi:hypothetical protein